MNTWNNNIILISITLVGPVHNQKVDPYYWSEVVNLHHRSDSKHVTLQKPQAFNYSWICEYRFLYIHVSQHMIKINWKEGHSVDLMVIKGNTSVLDLILSITAIDLSIHHCNFWNWITWYSIIHLFPFWAYDHIKKSSKIL